ncbi:hypothetical protein FG386_001341 [Cryptosporidium ryanae]|uniref:uncharacterized protein n=1 Tax=Cryptosporidium ryanae TaxID=515981 RepID=UPI00351A6F62|nr:hypothetical protein FG386_001341 [Cryptosporidium ryanae]
MSQSLTTRQSKPKTLDPQKRIQVVYSLNQFEKALEHNNGRLETDEVKNLVTSEKQKIQDVINQLRQKDKPSTGSNTSNSQKNATNNNTNPGTNSGNSNSVGSSVSNAIAASTILVPPVEVCPLNIKKTTKFRRPDHYIRFPVHKEFVSGIRLEDSSIVHYNMVKADEEFLDELRTKFKGGSGVSEIDFIKMIDLMEKSTARGPEISFDEAIQLTRDKNINIRNQLALIIYKYWKMRRQKLGKPLLRNFWPITSPHDSSPYACFRPRVREKMTLRRPRRNNKEMFDKLEKLLDDFRKVEKTFRKLRQRDEKKLLLAELDMCIFDQKRHEVFDPYYKSPLWDRLRNYKLQKRQQKKEMKNITFNNFGFTNGHNNVVHSIGNYNTSNFINGSGSSSLAQIGGSLNIINDISINNLNMNDLSSLLKQISIDICNLDLLLNYSWDNEISLLSYYYFGTLMLSSVFNQVKFSFNNKNQVLANNNENIVSTSACTSINNGENQNCQHISDNESSFSVDNNPNLEDTLQEQNLGTSNNSYPYISPAYQRMALPNYILSIYKNGVNLSRLKSLQNFRAPYIPHRLVRRRGRGGRIWFDRHSLNRDNYEPLFTDPYQLDYASNCGNNNQFMLDLYFKKSISMCEIVDRLCTENNFDIYGNDSQGSGGGIPSSSNDNTQKTSKSLSSSNSAENTISQGMHSGSSCTSKNNETVTTSSASRSRGRSNQVNSGDANPSRLNSNKSNQHYFDFEMST